MAVGAAHAERADARDQGQVGTAPRPQLGLHAQPQGVERDVGVGRGEVEAGRDLPVLDTQRRLDQADDAGGAFQVPDVGLGGADGQRPDLRVRAVSAGRAFPAVRGPTAGGFARRALRRRRVVSGRLRVADASGAEGRAERRRLDRVADLRAGPV
jgi:hypothetical protein